MATPAAAPPLPSPFAPPHPHRHQVVLCLTTPPNEAAARPAVAPPLRRRLRLRRPPARRRARPASVTVHSRQRGRHGRHGPASPPARPPSADSGGAAGEVGPEATAAAPPARRSHSDSFRPWSHGTGPPGRVSMLLGHAADLWEERPHPAGVGAIYLFDPPTTRAAGVTIPSTNGVRVRNRRQSCSRATKTVSDSVNTIYCEGKTSDGFSPKCICLGVCCQRQGVANHSGERASGRWYLASTHAAMEGPLRHPLAVASNLPDGGLCIVWGGASTQATWPSLSPGGGFTRGPLWASAGVRAHPWSECRIYPHAHALRTTRSVPYFSRPAALHHLVGCGGELGARHSHAPRFAPCHQDTLPMHSRL